MTPSAPDRPNRLATCPHCGARMPRRFLTAHQQQHDPAAPDSPTPGGTLLCPACGQFIPPADFPAHMSAAHPNWCPLCRALPADLLDHLKRSHHVKPIEPALGFGPNWQTQPRFVCLWCKKNISVWSYPRHAQPHGMRPTPPKSQKRGPE